VGSRFVDLPKIKSLLREWAHSRRAVVLGAAGVAVVSALIYGLSGLSGASSHIPAATSQNVVARGRIEPVERARTVQGPPGAIIHKLFVNEGDKVAAGTVLAEIDTRASLTAGSAMEERRLEEAEQQLAQITAPAKQADIEAQNAVIRKLQSELQRLQKDYERTRALAERDLVAAETLDARRSAMEQAAHALDQAQWTQRSLLKPREIDVKVAQARVATQRDAVAKAKADLSLTQIRAPVDGTVLALMIREGEALGPDGLLQMADLSHLIVVAEVDEFDIARVALGRAVVITGPSLTAPIPGAVSRIANAVFKQKRPTSDVLVGRDARIIEVEITPSAPLPPVVWGEVTVTAAGTP
jgi:HlyD family secretion protein